MKKQYETKVITPDTKDEKPEDQPDTTIRHDGEPKDGGFRDRCPKPEEDEG